MKQSGWLIPAVCLVSMACAHNTARTAPDAAGRTPAAEAAQAPSHEHMPSHEQMPSTEHAQMLPATGGPGYTAADVRFMQHMIGHHAQALLMTAMVPTHGADGPLLQLAEKIDISQRDEIRFMEKWLADREQAVPASGHTHAMADMPGMLTPDQLAQLDAARGQEFEGLFLRFMIQHHRGALQMVEELFDNPGAGQDSEIFRFATDVDADQRDEIYVMQSMLDMLGTERGSRSE